MSPHVKTGEYDSGDNSFLTNLSWKRVLVLIVCCPFLLLLLLLLGGCRSQSAEVSPSIEFTMLPAAAEGGPSKLDMIGGRVLGARDGQRIVLFARSGTWWWIQPMSNQPFTTIQPDSTWKNSTHLGTEYAALLVSPGYRPPAKTDSLPAVGGAVVAVRTVKGKESAPPVSKTLQFSGYEWLIRTADSDRGGSINSYDAANAWTDKNGFLHLRIARRSGQWTCAEVNLTRSLGYGSYVFVVRETSHLEPATVLSMFTWDDDSSDPNHRELDIEIARWGDPVNKNAQYVIQPYYVPANVNRFVAPSGVLTHSFRWEQGRVTFRTVRGAESDESRSRVVAEHVFTSGVPFPGGELVHLNLYLFGAAKQTLQNEAEVVIEKFEYLP